MSTKKHLIKALEHLLDECPKNVFYKRSGICRQVGYLQGNEAAAMCVNTVRYCTGKTWPIYPYESGGYPGGGYPDRWKNDALLARISLMKHILRYLKAPWYIKPFIREWKTDSFQR